MEEENLKLFEDYQGKIIEAIRKRLGDSGITENVQLVSGLGMLPINPELSNNIYLGKALPIIAVVGEKSGRVYFFSYNTLYSDIYDETGNEQKKIQENQQQN